MVGNENSRDARYQGLDSATSIRTGMQKSSNRVLGKPRDR